LSKPNYTAEELANIDPPPVEWQGKRCTAYEATQKSVQSNALCGNKNGLQLVMPPQGCRTTSP
jgi:hypothetical protein